MLEILLANPDILVRSGDLLARLRGDSGHTNPSYLRLYMAQLRRKLEPTPSRPRYLADRPRPRLPVPPEPGPRDLIRCTAQFSRLRRWFAAGADSLHLCRCQRPDVPAPPRHADEDAAITLIFESAWARLIPGQRSANLVRERDRDPTFRKLRPRFGRRGHQKPPPEPAAGRDKQLGFLIRREALTVDIPTRPSPRQSAVVLQPRIAPAGAEMEVALLKAENIRQSWPTRSASSVGDPPAATTSAAACNPAR